jgi:hypothetical protein
MSRFAELRTPFFRGQEMDIPDGNTTVQKHLLLFSANLSCETAPPPIRQTGHYLEQLFQDELPYLTMIALDRLHVAAALAESLNTRAAATAAAIVVI